jgi:energy-coupling factor transporter ATP-binding protein EcfA2
VTLALDRVSYRYAGARGPALREISLELSDGEVVGVVGASEAGKTTLCLVASGLAPRAAGGTLRGRVLVDGADTADWPMHEMGARIGIAFQSPTNQLSQVADTVFEEVAFGPMNLAIGRDDLLARTWDALDALRIADLAGRDPRRLSGGQQQLVAIAGLIAMRPRHLVLDEPTAQLDPAGTRLVAEAVGRLAADGASLLIAEQKTDLLAAVAKRVVALADGAIALEGNAAEVLGDERLTALGVPPPAAVRLTRLARSAQVNSGRLEEALRSG